MFPGGAPRPGSGLRPVGLRECISPRRGNQAPNESTDPEAEEGARVPVRTIGTWSMP